MVTHSERQAVEIVVRFCAAIIPLFNTLESTIRATARAMKLLEIKLI